MSYLIDTDIIIYSINGNDAVNRRFMDNEHIPKSISVITYGELLYGGRKSKRVEKNLAITYRIKELFPIIVVDKAVIETYSGIKAALNKTGNTLDDMDLIIAATALSMNAILVTNNEKHFARIRGLSMENWSR